MSSQQVAYPALEEVELRLRSGAIEAVTSDVFDTIVWRTVPEPTDVFVVLGQALRDREALDESLDPRSFALLRQWGEAAAREQLQAETGTTEVRLEEIWQRIPEWSHRPLGREEAVELEIEVEREVLVPDLEVVHLLLAANEAGVPVYAASDTYFSSAQLRSLFAQPFLEDIRFEGILTSSERRTGKAGTLFDHVLDAAGCTPELIVHLGDNSDADVIPARRRGIGTAHVTRRSERLSHLLRRESSYRRVRGLAPQHSEEAARADLAELDGSLVQLRAKMALHREAHTTPAALRPMWHYGAEVLGPACAGFADWAVEQARSMGVRRLHCLMREGDFLAELIDHAAAAADADVATAKLYLNRQVVTVAAICEASREELSQVALLRRDEPSVRQLLTILGVDTDLVPELSAHLDSRLDDGARREETLETLAGNELVRLRIQARAAELRERIVRLVRREQGESESGLTLVDLGWAASIQRRLGELLRQSEVDLQVGGLYLVTHAGAVETVAGGGRVGGFLANFGYPEATSEVVRRSPEVLEQVFMPSVGTQVGLTEELEPVVSEVLLPEAQRVEAEAVRDGIRAFQRTYLRYREALPEKIGSLADAADQLGPIVVRSCIDPTAEEAVRFGAWQHDSGEGTDRVESLADDRLAAHLLHLQPRQLYGPASEGVYWPSAVARVCDPHLADLVAAQNAGLLDEDAFATEAETGTMTIRASEGEAIEPGSGTEEIPRRNHRGLSFLSANLWAGHIERIQIVPGTCPTLLRVDRLVVRLHIRDASEPLEVRLDEPQTAHLLTPVNLLRFSERVFASTNEHGHLIFATPRATAPSQQVYRADIEFSFVALPWDSDTARMTSASAAERQLQEVLGSASWRLTGPLRRLSGLFRRRR